MRREDYGVFYMKLMQELAKKVKPKKDKVCTKETKDK